MKKVKLFNQEKMESKTKTNWRAMTYKKMKLYAKELGLEIPLGCVKETLIALIEKQVRSQVMFVNFGILPFLYSPHKHSSKEG